jgi:hypothetical protein
MFFEPLLTGDVWWLVVNKRRRRIDSGGKFTAGVTGAGGGVF